MALTARAPDPELNGYNSTAPLLEVSGDAVIDYYLDPADGSGTYQWSIVGGVWRETTAGGLLKAGPGSPALVHGAPVIDPADHDRRP